MNYRKTAWCLVPLLLLASFTCGTDAADQRETGQAQEKQIEVKAPQTAEELLVCIRDFLTNPDMDGFAFIEKVTGKHKETWKIDLTGTGLAKNPVVRWMVFHDGSQLSEPLAVPYRVAGFRLEESTYRLIDIGFIFRRKKSGVNDDYLLVLTPEMTQKIFGLPDKINVESPREFGRYTLKYTYMRGRYELQIPFWAPGDNDEQLKAERLRHSVEQIVQERTRRNLFENHKDFRAIRMRLYQQF